MLIEHMLTGAICYSRKPSLILVSAAMACLRTHRSTLRLSHTSSAQNETTNVSRTATVSTPANLNAAPRTLVELRTPSESIPLPLHRLQLRVPRLQLTLSTLVLVLLRPAILKQGPPL